MNSINNVIEVSQKKFYQSKFKQYAYSPKSLAWRDKESQYIRFDFLSELFQYETDHFTVHEIGCGLAHFNDFLSEKKMSYSYSGSDIVPEMLLACQKKYPGLYFSNASIVSDLDTLKKDIGGNDYYCLSGTFNTIQDNTIESWEKFIFATIGNMYSLSRKGISFNFLSKYSNYYIKDLYYANPSMILEWCLNNTSRFVSIIHNEPLYEFTVLIYTEEYMKQVFPYIEKRQGQK